MHSRLWYNLPMTTNIAHFKNLLETELATLENELATVGRKNPDRTGEWEAVEAEDIDPAEDAETAESIEVFDNNKAIVDQLDTRRNEVKNALGRINEGKYGTCEVCGADIEEDRLNANPAATTCKAHMN